MAGVFFLTWHLIDSVTAPKKVRYIIASDRKYEPNPRPLPVKGKTPEEVKAVKERAQYEIIDHITE